MSESEVRKLTKEEIVKLLSSSQLSKEEKKFILFLRLANTTGSAIEHTERISIIEGEADIILLERNVWEGPPRSVNERLAIIPKTVPVILEVNVKHWDANGQEYAKSFIYIFNGKEWASITTTSI